MSETETMFILGECATLNTDMGGKLLNPMRSPLSSSRCQQGIRRRSRGRRRRRGADVAMTVYFSENEMHLTQSKVGHG